MFDIGSSELLLIIIVAVVVIGPKDLPRVLYKLGQIIGKGRAMTRHFRSGIDEMIRQAELEEMEKKWAADNARIMAQTPVGDAATPVADAGAEQAALPAPEPAAGFDPVESETGSHEVGPGNESAVPQDDVADPSVASAPAAGPPPRAEGGPSA